MTKHLTPDQATTSHAWLYDVFVAARKYAGPAKRAGNYQYMSPYNNTIGPNSITIAEAIINRQVSFQQFQKIDDSLRALSWYRFAPVLGTNQAFPAGSRKKPEMLAKYIANFCAENKFYWDDSRLSTVEQQEIITNTIIGQALFEFSCFTSQDPAKAKSSKQSTSKAATSGASSSAGNAPTSSYKVSGPQSGNARGLVGQPSQKLQVNSLVFKIEGVNQNAQKVIPSAFVRPLDKIGEASPGVNKVFMGSANGYTTCTCYFEKLQDAQNFLQKLLASSTIPSNISNVHIAKTTANKNGYFLVATEFGNCAIVAQKLNEEVEESTSAVYGIRDIDVYEEVFKKYD